jgi:myo-inositol 2-dehydrogenase / D-chiro-inositol 1-dehydrogenase
VTPAEGGMRIGLIGAGVMARRHLDVLRRLEAVSVAAVCDADAARAEAVAGETGARVLPDWEAVIAAESVDAVFVCTPPGAHAAPAIAAMEAGLAVYLEKPLARAIDDGETIAAVWSSRGVVCAVGYQWRSLDLVDRVRAALAGAPPGLMVARSYGPTEPGRRDLEGGSAWFADPAASGGILFELASHDIDLQVALAGAARRVQAASAHGLLALARKPGSRLDDAVAVTVEFESGAIGLVAVGWNDAAQPPLYTLDVQAQDVALELVLDPAFTLSGTARGERVEARSPNPRVTSVERFLAAARAGDPAAVACTPADALLTLRAVLAAEAAIRGRQASA